MAQFFLKPQEITPEAAVKEATLSFEQAVKTLEHINNVNPTEDTKAALSFAFSQYSAFGKLVGLPEKPTPEPRKP